VVKRNNTLILPGLFTEQLANNVTDRNSNMNINTLIVMILGEGNYRRLRRTAIYANYVGSPVNIMKCVLSGSLREEVEMDNTEDPAIVQRGPVLARDGSSSSAQGFNLAGVSGTPINSDIEMRAVTDAGGGAGTVMGLAYRQCSAARGAAMTSETVVVNLSSTGGASSITPGTTKLENLGKLDTGTGVRGEKAAHWRGYLGVQGCAGANGW